MKKEQAKKLFLQEVKALGLRKPMQKHLNSIRNLAPGDFAAIRRQHRFNSIRNTSDFIERLKEECMLKERSNSKEMGFLAS